MHRYLPVCLLLAQAVWAGDEVLMSAFRQTQHRVQRDGGGYRADNPENRLSAQFTPAGLTALHPGGFFSLRLNAYGYGNRLRTPAPPSIHSDGARVEYRRGPLTEWYLNETRGLEQGFTLSERPAHAGAGPLTLELGLSGDLRPVLAGRDVRLERNGHEVLRYAGLRAWDAAGRDLPARLEVRGSRIRLLVTDAGAAYPVTIDPWIQQQELTAADGAAADYFGISVSVSGDTAVVGANQHTVGAIRQQGAAYVFVRNGTAWTMQQELSPSDGTAFMDFGRSVAIDGDTVVVGADEKAVGFNNNQGAVYVFVRSGTVWTQQQKLTASDGTSGDKLGFSVALSGDTAVIGDLPISLSGAAYVFVRSGTVWSQQQKLTPSDGALGGAFAFSVSVNGDTAVVGAYNKGQSAQGAAYVFVRNGSVWSQQQELLPSNSNNNDHFGYAVAIDADTALIGAYNKIIGANSGEGATYVYERSGTVWTVQQELVPSDGFIDDLFGSSVSVSGNTAVIGSPSKQTGSQYLQGEAYVFVRSGTVWTQQPPLLVPASGGAASDSFGVSVSASGSTAAIGAQFKTVSGNTQQGAAYVFVAALTTGLRDFLGTGLSDALLYDPTSGDAYTALSNGSGSYTYVAETFTPGFDTLRTGDFNGDGKADLVVYNSQTALAYIGMSNGDGTFAFQSLFWSAGYDFVEPGDLNGDGKTDFALYNSSTGTMYTAISNGDGTFTYKYTLISQGFTFVRLADFSGDGKADILVYNAANGVAFVGIGDGAGGFAFQPLSISPGYDLDNIGDLNGDGKADLLLYNSTNGNAVTGISDGAGGFAFTPLIFTRGFTAVLLADYTGDGKADVTLYNKNTATAYFGTGTGTGTFNFQSLFWSPNYNWIQPEDVNGDGKIDVILYNSLDGTEYTGISNGNGTFTYTYQYWGIGRVLAR
jgi:hypothetical protein